MSEYTLTLLDASGIQNYIFSTNRLQEIIGASHLVESATQEWAYETLKDLFPGGHNVSDVERCMLDDKRRIEDENGALRAEVIYAGGGNTAILFCDQEDALRFTRTLTRKVLKEAPGLQILAAHNTVRWEKDQGDALSQKVRHTIETKLAHAKQARQASLPLLGLGVTAACESTGLPASDTDLLHRLPGEQGNPRLISSQVIKKLVARGKAHERLKKLFEQQLGDWYEFPSQFDELGRRFGEESYIAVIHADGNGMGSRVNNLRDRYPQASQNREYILQMRQFSCSIRDTAMNALSQLIVELARQDPEKIHISGQYLPFRPLVFGGDDTTFVSSGELGLSLAARYLELLEQKKLDGVPEEDQKLHACAGISIVKMHYPFARAYAISEELCRSAKKWVRKQTVEQNMADFSALDWHFSTSGLSGSLQAIRRREYQPPEGDLTMRPVRLCPAEPDVDGRAWYDRLEKLVNVFIRNEEWADRRNKVKALRQALRVGPAAVEEFRRTYRLGKLPELIPGSDKYREKGWLGEQCGYFDAIELMDHYVPLELGGTP